MARLLQQSLAAHDAMSVDMPAISAPADDDYAIGFESADPSLQFEAWEPLPAAMPASPMG